MQKLTMHTSQTYDILMEDNLLASAAKYIAEMLPPIIGAEDADRKCCIVSDRTVYGLYGKGGTPLQESLMDAGYEVGYYAFPDGEDSKTLSTVEDICAFLAENHFTREDFIIALGGGVCGDVAGFAASVYMRGVPYVQIPTTLLAMADSSIGGKTGVNTEAGKNMIGTFWQPHLVLIDPKTLETLPEDELLNGLAEIIKAGFIADGTIFDAISEDLTDAIFKAIRVKQVIVEADERESDCRRLLNFGHTIGHALEKCSD
ncbi:MAG: 3-dehydroquinate synthase family protein, partial [Bacillota bacterium]